MRKMKLWMTSAFLCLTLSGCGGREGMGAEGQIPSAFVPASDSEESVSLEDSQVQIGGESPEQQIFSQATAETAEPVETAEPAESVSPAEFANPTESVSPTEFANPTESVSPAEFTNPAEPTVTIHSRNLEEIKEYLAQFPETLEKLQEASCYVVVDGTEKSGREYFNNFIENMSAGIPAELVYVQCTTEGDPVLTYLNADGEDVYCVTDVSRDKLAGNGDKYFETYYGGVWVTAEKKEDGDTLLSLCTTDEEGRSLTLLVVETKDGQIDGGLPPWAKPPAPG